MNCLLLPGPSPYISQWRDRITVCSHHDHAVVVPLRHENVVSPVQHVVQGSPGVSAKTYRISQWTVFNSILSDGSSGANAIGSEICKEGKGCKVVVKCEVKWELWQLRNQVFDNTVADTQRPVGLLHTPSSHIWVELDDIAQWISQAPDLETKTNGF